MCQNAPRMAYKAPGRWQQVSCCCPSARRRGYAWRSAGLVAHAAVAWAPERRPSRKSSTHGPQDCYTKPRGGERVPQPAVAPDNSYRGPAGLVTPARKLPAGPSTHAACCARRQGAGPFCQPPAASSQAGVTPPHSYSRPALVTRRLIACRSDASTQQVPKHMAATAVAGRGRCAPPLSLATADAPETRPQPSVFPP